MDQEDAIRYLGLLAAVLLAAKLCAAAARSIGQPAVLGELIAGVVVGQSLLGWLDPADPVLHVLAEVGVVILLFEIGLETDLGKMLRVGGAAATVAAVGVVLPFALGYAVCWLMGLAPIVGVVAGAALTATSVGITARVFADLGRLQDPESQIVLGAAVLDDVIGLVVLTLVAGLAGGEAVTAGRVARITGVAFGFLAAALVVGGLVVPPLFRAGRRLSVPGTPIVLALVLAFAMAWLADRAGSAGIIGAFAAGLLLARTPEARGIEHEVASVGHFFVPLFFASVGAAVDLRALSPFDPANSKTLAIGGLLIAAALAGKFLAGYAPFWFRGHKAVIGIGMVPRGEVGLIFAQLGLASGVFDAGLFGAVTLMVMATTFAAPPLLKALLGPPPAKPPPPEGVGELVGGA